jgi:hypothetical protein
MGFKVGRTFTLEFYGTDLAGAIVKMRSCTIGTLEELKDPENGLDDELRIMAEHTVEWNLEDEDGPIPVSIEGYKRLEIPVRDLIYVEWQKATKGVTAPLDHRSSDGEKSATPEIPQEPM